MSTVTTPSKTASGTLLALDSAANSPASSVVIGTPVDFSAKLGGLAYVRFGRRSATAAGASANIRLEASFAASGDNSWFPFATLTTTFAAVEPEAVSGTVASGQKVITVASTSNLTAADLVFIDNTSTPSLSEFGRVKSIVANTSITIEDNLVTAATGFTLYDGAEIFPPVAIPAGAVRIRVVVDASLFTQAWACEARYTSIDNLTNV